MLLVDRRAGLDRAARHGDPRPRATRRSRSPARRPASSPTRATRRPRSTRSGPTASARRSTRARSSSSPASRASRTDGDDHHARPRRLRHHRRRARGRASAPTCARSTPTSTASTPPTRASCPTRARSTSISYEEMLEMAATRRRRAAAAQRRVRAQPRRASSTCRSSFNDAAGHDRQGGRRDHGAGDHLRRHARHLEAKVTIRDVPDRPASPRRVFRPLADANVNVDMIIQNVSEDGTTDISFTVAQGRPRPRDAPPLSRRRPSSARATSRSTSRSRRSRSSAPA